MPLLAIDHHLIIIEFFFSNVVAPNYFTAAILFTFGNF